MKAEAGDLINARPWRATQAERDRIESGKLIPRVAAYESHVAVCGSHSAACYNERRLEF